MKILSIVLRTGLVLLILIILGSLFVAYVLPADDDTAYNTLVEKQNSSFKTSIADNQKTWDSVPVYIENQSFVIGKLDSYTRTDSTFYKEYYPSNHGCQVSISRKMDGDSISFKIQVFHSTHPAPFIEKQIALFMKTGVTKYNFKK
jgi:hypothetical protein